MTCDICEYKLVNGTEYYELNDMVICEDCIDEFLKTIRKVYEDDEMWVEAEREVRDYIESIKR